AIVMLLCPYDLLQRCCVITVSFLTLHDHQTRMHASTDWHRASHQGTGREGMHTRACAQGRVGNSHRGRLRTEDGPNGSSNITKPLSFIRWISCGRTDANCTPSTCVNSAIDTRTRRHNSDIMSSCVGSDIGMIPWKWRGHQQCVVGVPIIHGLER